MNYGIASAALVVLLALYIALRRRSTIRNIRGPTSPSWIFGNMRQLMLSRTYGDHEFAWQKLYGSVYRFKGCFGEERLMVSDPLALQYILNSGHFALSPVLQNMVGLVFGDGSLMGIRGKVHADVRLPGSEDATGQMHRRIRNEFNIGFSAAAVRTYQPIFEKVAQAISQELEATDAPSVNIIPLLGTATLSAIAEAALSYSVQDLGEEFVATNVQILAASSSQSAGQFLADAIGVRLPAWLLRAAIYLPTKTFNTVRRAKYLANQLGERVVQNKKDTAQRGLDIDRDVFGVLLDADHSDTMRNTLTGEEVVDQTAIIMIAGQNYSLGDRCFSIDALAPGQDTTANTVGFALLELARNPELQNLLRTEIHSAVGAGGLSNVAYDRMPLLNAFIKEALRFYPAEALTERMALQDTAIPLSESIITSTGEQISEISVRKGQITLVGIASYQRLESRWGKDAHQFRPSRWLDGTVATGGAVGPYANLLTFLGGPHTCLGWRFALLEMQVIFCELVGKFSFALPDHEPVRVRIANTLVPTMLNGQKGYDGESPVTKLSLKPEMSRELQPAEHSLGWFGPFALPARTYQRLPPTDSPNQLAECFNSSYYLAMTTNPRFQTEGRKS
ncbi:cytochrome P450 [Mycena leptocephala]|nr:cytochrome P450 [Mycena leptocephala]